MHTWDEAAARWVREKGHKTSLHRDRAIFCGLEPHLTGLALSEIDRDKLSRVAEVKAAQSSPATANRHLALVRAVLRRAHEVWEWIDHHARVPMYTVRDRRVRWLTPDEARRLISHLPAHQAAMARFALATGLRQRNVRRLRWADMDEARRCAWVHADESKNGKAIAVPLNAKAVTILRGQRGQHCEYVFTYAGRPVRCVNTGAWRRAVAAAGLKNFRWHDLRHTWASWHVQSGTPLHVLQELGGWSSYEMVQRYAHLSVAHLKPFADRINGKVPGGAARGRRPH